MRKKLKWILVLLALYLAAEKMPGVNAASSSRGGNSSSAAYKRDANYKSVSK
jgi:hypothetical protein